jgi:hypothetical protein
MIATVSGILLGIQLGHWLFVRVLRFGQVVERDQ